jgi:hypothetical protein
MDAASLAGPLMGLGTGGLPPADNVVAEVAVFDRDWVLSEMVVDHEMFDMEVSETWRMDGNEKTRSKTNVQHALASSQRM